MVGPSGPIDICVRTTWVDQLRWLDQVDRPGPGGQTAWIDQLKWSDHWQNRSAIGQAEHTLLWLDHSPFWKVGLDHGLWTYLG